MLSRLGGNVDPSEEPRFLCLFGMLVPWSRLINGYVSNLVSQQKAAPPQSPSELSRTRSKDPLVSDLSQSYSRIGTSLTVTANYAYLSQRGLGPSLLGMVRSPRGTPVQSAVMRLKPRPFFPVLIFLSTDRGIRLCCRSLGDLARTGNGFALCFI